MAKTSAAAVSAAQWSTVVMMGLGELLRPLGLSAREARHTLHDVTVRALSLHCRFSHVASVPVCTLSVLPASTSFLHKMCITHTVRKAPYIFCVVVCHRALEHLLRVSVMFLCQSGESDEKCLYSVGR